MAKDLVDGSNPLITANKINKMRNYFDYWSKRFIKDGLKAIKSIIGIGLAVSLGYSISLPIGILFFSWVLVESLIDRN